MDFKKVYNFDKEACEQGRWFPFRGAEVLVARSNSKRYRDAVKRHRAAFQSIIDARVPLSDDQIEKMTIEVAADAVLLGWRGFEEDGVEVPYSRDNAVRLLTEHPEFRDDIANIANSEDNFRIKAAEADAGNSPTS